MRYQLRKIIAPVSLLALGLITTLSSFISPAGGDVFEIYVNNKLVIQQRVFDEKGPQTIELGKTERNAQISVSYSHCGVAGKGRHLTFKDENDRVLKVWKYADGAGGTSMHCAVNEVFSAKGLSTGKVHLYYSSAELPKEKLLAVIEI